jgi:hypothetical protein
MQVSYPPARPAFGGPGRATRFGLPGIRVSSAETGNPENAQQNAKLVEAGRLLMVPHPNRGRGFRIIGRRKKSAGFTPEAVRPTLSILRKQ